MECRFQRRPPRRSSRPTTQTDSPPEPPAPTDRTEGHAYESYMSIVNNRTKRRPSLANQRTAIWPGPNRPLLVTVAWAIHHATRMIAIIN